MNQGELIFVTGGNGFIGSRVVHELHARGYAARCLLRQASETIRIDDIPFERVYGDVRDADSLRRGMEGAGGCIHLAGISSWAQMNTPALEEIICGGTRNVLEAALSAGGVRTVYVSSAVAINASDEPKVFDETSPFELLDTPMRYAIAKHRAEQVVREYVERGLDAVIVNPVEVYGPQDTALITACNIRDILKNYPSVACTGGTAIAHVDDVADGIIRALERGRAGERYILGGDNLSVEGIVRLTLEIAGQKKPVLRVPNKLLKGLTAMLERLRLPSPVLPGVLEYATRFFFVDSGKAMRELGYAPRPARQVLTPVVEWLRASGEV